MNNLIFDNNQILSKQISVNELRNKVNSNFESYKNKNLKLFISQKIRDIIVSEMAKISEMSN